MVRLREIPRTATFTWSPGTDSPFIATGTRAGAVDADFSNETQLELWDLDLDNSKLGVELEPAASIGTDSGFHDIAWVQAKDDFPRGVIAGALENGALDLWNAEKLLNGDGNAFISRTEKHSGAIKALQFNPFRSELLATAGAKGELFISDLNNVANPFRLGNSAARPDDFECLDWNKKVPHIMVTGSSGGFVTVWDVKAKKESLTLNNSGRKPVSAIAWDPEKPTRLITAVPLDTDPLILVWDLRNPNAPEKVLRGHEGGVLSLSWCQQDSDLLLSCGKDNQTICWNPQTGESYGEFPIVTNWTFQTRWNPHNPNLLATASFDGKLSVQTIQNTKTETDDSVGKQTQALDGEDFFTKAQSQPQTASFTLPKAPKWLERPCGASFGFGGKVISFNLAGGVPRQSTVRVTSFAIDSDVGTSTETFEKAMNEHDLTSICESKISQATFEAEKTDWKVIETLISGNPRKELVKYLGIPSSDDETNDGVAKLTINGNEDGKPSTQANGVVSRNNRLSAFFDNSNDGDNFLSDLAATKGAKTNNPFHIYDGEESEADRKITRALMLGQFEKAMEACLEEDRMSDAFMIAICGGQKCIDLVQKAYFTKQAKGPNYLRLLASIVGKNLWDFVYNADLENWKEVMATLCTYASADEFPDLCEALGDRLEDQRQDDVNNSSLRKDASFCYLAGSKLEKVVGIWIADLEHNEKSGSQDESHDSTFSVHARSLQNFIEKVTVFREVTHYEDNDRRSNADWKLAPLYDKYTEYAEIVASHGQLQIAEKYLGLLPDKYPAAEIARNRVKQATRKTPAPTAPTAPRQPLNAARPTQRPSANVPSFEDRRSPVPIPTVPATNPYAPSTLNQSQNPYAPPNLGPYGAPAYQPQNLMQQHPRQQHGMALPSAYGAPPKPQPLGPPPRNLNASPSIPPPSKAQNMTNWNDTPESFFKPPTSRRGTPGVGTPAINNPFPIQQSTPNQPAVGPPFGAQPRSTAPAPPPKGLAPPPTLASPQANEPQSYLQPERPSSSAANIYAPQQPTPQLVPSQQHAVMPRGPSPYNAPPSGPPPSNRYAPAPATQPAAPVNQMQPPMSAGTRQGPPPPNPYAPQQSYAAPQPNFSNQQPYGVPPQASTPSQGPPAGPPQGSRPGTAQSQRGNKVSKPSTPKHPPGDRSHIPANARTIYEILNDDMQRVKSKAPASFKQHVNDAEKRLNILFDHLNNEDLLKPETVQDMTELAQALRSRDYDRAQAIHIDIMTNKMDECGNWMVGVKRLIGMSRATP